MTHTPTPEPRPTRPAAPVSWLRDETLLTIYGRAFSVAPILGRLGIDNNFSDLEWQIQPYARGIKANNGGKETRIAVHLIYGMAVPCADASNCLYYLDDAGVNIVKQYVEPAARRHWLVVLDDQLGRSDPATEVRRLAAKGYLAYDNVEIALDPEFRTGPYQPTPGIPVGSIDGSEINAAQAYVNAYSARHHLRHRKVLIVHQFQVAMIQNRAAIKSDYPWVDPVFDADGFGPPGIKAGVYHQLLGPGASQGVRWRGIKLFLPNPYETTHHSDDPPMTWSQALGRQKAVDFDGSVYYVRPGPNVIVIA